MTWSEVFFNLHKHCNLDKWKIQDYTYPQIQELLKQCNKFIEFEVQTRRSGSLAGLFGGGGEDGSSEPITTGSGVSDDSGREEISEDDVNMLARVLGGG